MTVRVQTQILYLAGVLLLIGWGQVVYHAWSVSEIPDKAEQVQAQDLDLDRNTRDADAQYLAAIANRQKTVAEFDALPEIVEIRMLLRKVAREHELTLLKDVPGYAPYSATELLMYVENKFVKKRLNNAENSGITD